MRWRHLLLMAIIVSSCARPRPALTPDLRAFEDVPESESGVVEPEEKMDITIPAFNPLTGAGVADQINSRFRGTDRKDPKTTIASASRQNFNSLPALIATLPGDDAMRNHNPEIESGSMFRAIEERRNVRVRAWIYAIKYEADQDWHVILGTNPASSPRTFFNAEISGLPASSAAAHATLLNARKQLATILANELPGGSGYRKYKTPIRVEIDGSLFFDVDHEAGVVGPEGMRPSTAWEIHPVTRLRLQ